MSDLKKALVLLAVMASFLVVFFLQRSAINSLRDERDRYQSNNTSLLEDIGQYMTKDSLHAAEIGALRLTVSEFEKYRAADAELIKTLNIKNRELASITSAQTKTIKELRCHVKDTIIYHARDTLNLRCLDIEDNYIKLHGCMDGEEFNGTIEIIDSLTIVETIKYKRFLGFLWKTSKVADRKIDVVSSNPNTTIEGLEFVTIEQ